MDPMIKSSSGASASSRSVRGRSRTASPSSMPSRSVSFLSQSSRAAAYSAARAAQS